MCRCLFQKRWAATAAATKKQIVRCVGEEKISRLPNGLTVYSKDMNGCIAQLVLAFRAGSRYEQPDEVGIAHFIRNSVGIDSERNFASKLLWQCGSAGVGMVSHLSRDFFAVQASVSRDHAAYTLPLLGELAQPGFKPWDVEDAIETVRTDIAYMKQHDKLMDILHYAAFRSEPLGNCLFAKEESLGKYDFRNLRSFADSRLVAGQAVLVGINIGHDDMLAYVDGYIKLREGSGKPGPLSKYFGGEARLPTLSDKVHVAIAGEGSSLKNMKDLAIQQVLLSSLVEERCTNYGPQNKGIVSRAAFKASNGYPYELSTFNEVYWDVGLFGICLAANSDKVAPFVHAVVDALKSFSLDDKTFENAIGMAETSYILRSTISKNIALDCSVQLLGTDAVVKSSDFLQLIRSVTRDDVNKAASRMANKLTLASCGNIYQVPYLDQL